MRLRGPLAIYAGVQRRARRFARDASSYRYYRRVDYGKAGARGSPGIEASLSLLSAQNPLVATTKLAVYLNSLEDSVAADETLLREYEVAARRILNGEIQVYGRRLEPGSVIDWNADVTSGGSWPKLFFTRYRNLVNGRRGNYGDYRHTWELNRQQHLLPLSILQAISADEPYLRCIVDHILTWIAQNPPFWTLNWMSSMELGLRMVSWCLALTRVPEGALDEASRREILLSIYQQMRFLLEHLSVEYSDAGSDTVLKNNHTILELCCVMIVSACLPPLAESVGVDEGRKAELLRHLLTELERQTSADGMHVEQATSYLRFVLESLLLTRLVVPASEDLDTYIHAYMRALEAFRYTDDRIFLIGDEDNGHVLLSSFKAMPDSITEVLNMYATLYPEGFDTADLTTQGDAGEVNRAAVSILRDSGHWISRFKERSPTLCVYFRAGRMDFPTIPGYAPHAHCDLLSLNLVVDGQPWLVDRGTMTYRDRPLQDELRSSRAHNTLMIDGLEQMRLLGAFHSDRHARCELEEATSRRVSGLMTLVDGGRQVTVRRTIEVDPDSKRIDVFDEVEGLTEEAVWLMLNLHPSVEVPGSGVLSRAGSEVRLRLIGWEDAKRREVLFSPRYGVGSKATQLMSSATSDGSTLARKQWSILILCEGGSGDND